MKPALSLPVLLWLAPLWALAQDPGPGSLPDPLPLGVVLGLEIEAHPAVALAAARQARGRAERQAAAASDDLRLDLSLTARWTQPFSLEAVDGQRNDSRAVLSLRKRLYDFGRTEADVAASEAELTARGLLRRYALAQQRLVIMRRFLEVLLADKASTRDTEFMTIAYLRWDRKRDRADVGQVSDVDLLAAENAYQQARIRQIRSEQQARYARARLAEALNRPDHLPNELVPPALNLDRPLPEVDRLIQQALAKNPALQAARQRIEAGQQRLQRARREDRPTLTGVVESGYYMRRINSRDPLAASLVLDVPLYQGEAVQAEIGRQRADLQQAQARYREQELALRERVLALWQEVQLRQAQREQARVRSDYRDLYLDRSRGRYELEMQSDLGDAMARHLEATLKRDEADYRLALALAELDILLGRGPMAVLADNRRKE